MNMPLSVISNVGATSVYLSVFWVLTGLHGYKRFLYSQSGEHGVEDHAVFTACLPVLLTHLTPAAFLH